MHSYTALFASLLAAVPAFAFTNGTLVPAYICNPNADGMPKTFGQLLQLTREKTPTVAFNQNKGQNVQAPQLNQNGNNGGNNQIGNSAYILASLHDSPNNLQTQQQSLKVQPANGNTIVAGQTNQLQLSTSDGSQLKGAMLYGQDMTGARQGNFKDANNGPFVPFLGCGQNPQGQISGVIQQTGVSQGSTYNNLAYNAPACVQGNNITIGGLSVTGSGFGVWSYSFQVTGSNCNGGNGGDANAGTGGGSSTSGANGGSGTSSSNGGSSGSGASSSTTNGGGSSSGSGSNQGAGMPSNSGTTGNNNGGNPQQSSGPNSSSGSSGNNNSGNAQQGSGSSSTSSTSSSGNNNGGNAQQTSSPTSNAGANGGNGGNSFTQTQTQTSDSTVIVSATATATVTAGTGISGNNGNNGNSGNGGSSGNGGNAQTGSGTGNSGSGNGSSGNNGNNGNSGNGGSSGNGGNAQTGSGTGNSGSGNGNSGNNYSQKGNGNGRGKQTRRMFRRF